MGKISLNSNPNALKIRTSKEVAEEAINKIKENRSGEQFALYSHWKKLDDFIGNWQFNNINVIAGMSGLGKSYFLILLYKAFLDRALNGGFKKKFRILHFGFEMASYLEFIRMCMKDMNYTFREILSIDNILPESAFDEVSAMMASMGDLEIYFVEVSGNRQEIYDTIMHFKQLYPDDELVTGFDHGLLANYMNEKDEIELLAKLSVMFLDIKKKIHTMHFQISQLNDKIEDDNRILRPALHYPKKKDLHGSKQVFQCADDIYILHSPERLGIQSYGPDAIDSTDLIALHKLKARNGNLGILCMKNELHRGMITEF